MVPGTLADRVVEVIADHGTSGRTFASGCIVVGRTVLTAAHAVAGARDVLVRDPRKREYRETVDQRLIGSKDGHGPDVALVELDAPALDLAPMAMARVDRGSPNAAVPCRAVGYPYFAERRGVRDTADALGHIPVLSKLASGLLSLQVHGSPPEPLSQDRDSLGSPWSGMSGAPVVAGEYLLGVVTEHALREGPLAITVTPLTALEPDPAYRAWGAGVDDPARWWARLRVAGLADLRLLPRPRRPRRRPEPAYRSIVREIRARTGQLLGRERELAEIAAFAIGEEGYRWLEGEPWAGKTALLAEAVATKLPAQVDVIACFLSRRDPDRQDSNKFLADVVRQLADLLQRDQPEARMDQFHALWHQAKATVTTRDRHLLLVVDGLDEDLRPAGSLSVAAVLPAVAGGRAHVMVSSRPGLDLRGARAGHPLLTAQKMRLEPYKGAPDLETQARNELRDLKEHDPPDLTVEVLGVLTAAAGPLAVEDLAELTTPQRPADWDDRRRVRNLVTEAASRILQPVDPAGSRYQFAHGSLLESAQADKDLSDPEFRHRIEQWARRWQDAKWPVGPEPAAPTPRYLLDAYPGTLHRDPQQLAALVGDVNWATAAILTTGVDVVLAELRTAVAGLTVAPAGDPAVRALEARLAAVRGQAHNLRSPPEPPDPGYVLRQLCLQAAELGEDELAADLRERLLALAGHGLVPRWTTRRANRYLVAEFDGRAGAVKAVAVLPGRRVVSGGDDGRVRVWDLAGTEGRPVQPSHHSGRVNAVAVLPDGRVVSGGDDRQVRLWDLDDPQAEPVKLGHHSGGVHALAVLPDGRVVSGGDDGWVLVWDPDDPQAEPVKLGHHSGGVHALAVTPQGQVVSGGDDDWVRLWDLATPGSPRVELGPKEHGVHALAATEGRVVSGDDDGWVLVWDPDDPQAEPVKLGHHHGGVHALAIAPQGQVVSGGRDGWVRLWDLTDPKVSSVDLGRHRGVVHAVAVAPQGWVASGGDDGRVRVWDLAGTEGRPVQPGHHSGRVNAVAVLPGRRVVSGGHDGRVLVWDLARPGSPRVELGRHDGWVTALAVLPDGWVVSGGTDGQVLVWDLARPGSPRVELGPSEHGVNALAVLPGRRVVSGGDEGQVLVWDLADPKASPEVLGRHDGWVTALAVLPDEWVVSGGTDRRVHVWDARQPRRKWVPGPVACSVQALAAGGDRFGDGLLAVAHTGAGMSVWTIAGAPLRVR